MTVSKSPWGNKAPPQDRDRHMLKIVVDLANHSGERPASLPSVAHNTGYSLSYIEKLIAPLQGRGIIRGLRGSKGGYVLARPANQITIDEILSAISNPNRGKADEESAFAQVVNSLFEMATEIRWAILRRITLADLMDGSADSHPFIENLLVEYRGKS